MMRIMGQKRSGIIADLFDYWSPHIDQEEFAFYRRFAEGAGGPILEAASGTGRILLPLKKLGFDVEGLEHSKSLRDECGRQAKYLGIELPKLYTEKLEDFRLSRSYALIFVTLGSFQLIRTWQDAYETLRHFHDGLGQGGKLLLSLFYPWMENKLFESNDWHIVSDERDKKKGLRFIRREKCYHDPVEQSVQGKVRFEVWDGRRLIEGKEKDLYIRWYSRQEMAMMLEKLGFTNIRLHRSYHVSKFKSRDFMIFEAQKK